MIELKPDVIVIASTNPVELVAQWISEYYNHRIKVFGSGTSIDTYRLNYLLGKHGANISIK
ncbi:MAG: hypothetical protein RLO81_03950 [Fulvivirga sp.]|uniref:hypothetical protein n=1 Tax=Fulvivirga sp. TaxID=1931237 RepID=UPI0032F02EF8